MENRLLKNSPHFLLIQSVWLDKYEGQSLVVLPEPLDKYLHIDEFVDRQRSQIKSLKDQIINEWMPLLAKIYRDQISALNRSQSKCELFFDTCATFLYVQIRGLIEKSMDAFLDYFRQYDLRTLNPPDTVVYLEKTRNQYENCFLSVRVSHRKDDIYFMDLMEDLESKILSVLESLRSFS